MQTPYGLLKEKKFIFFCPTDKNENEIARNISEVILPSQVSNKIWVYSIQVYLSNFILKTQNAHHTLNHGQGMVASLSSQEAEAADFCEFQASQGYIQ